MGGNPAEDRSDAALMVLVCSARHRELRMAIDRGTVRWRPLTAKGANGPILWELDGDALQPFGPWDAMAGSDAMPAPLPRDWIEVATESAPGVLHPLAEWQQTVLDDLARMNS